MFKVLFIETLVYIAATIYRIEVAAFYASIVSVRIPASRTLVVTILIEHITKTPCGYTDDASDNNLPHYQPPPKIPQMKSSKSAKKEMNNIRSPATATPPRNQRISIMFDFLMIELILTYIVFLTAIEDYTCSNGNKSHNFSSKDLRIHALRDPASLRIAEQSLELLHLM